MSNADETDALEFSSVKDLTTGGFKYLVEGIKNANAIPSGSNYDFHSSADEYFGTAVNEEGIRILGLMNSILKQNGIETSLHNRSIDEKTELLIDANDQLLENVANQLDEYNGIKRKAQDSVEIQMISSAQLPVNGAWNQPVSTLPISSTKSSAAASICSRQPVVQLLAGKNIIRPQSFFVDKVDNSNTPWQPRIKEKPNSLKPLALYLEEFDDGGQVFSHPYEVELEAFEPWQEFLGKCDVVSYRNLSDTPLHQIETVGQLEDLIEMLRKYTEIAVDLEHHSYRSFMGITCLLQLSTIDADYLVDALSLRDHLWKLNEIFTKPSILKVFHGADMDIQWLQRDLSIYVVNMFDTHQAAIHLNYARRSLAYVLQKFCGIAADKTFQLADWRIRPLPDVLKEYARCDTHYLLHIYRRMRNDLVDLGKGENHLVKAVFDRSREICLTRYKKPICKENSYVDFYNRSKRSFDNRQLYALREIYNWRDGIARVEDESTGYVLPNHMMLLISESLPREMQGIFACCQPIPPLIRANALELHNMILKAREQPIEKAILRSDNRAKGSTLTYSRINFESPLHCPHDLTKLHEFRDDMPTLLNNDECFRNINIESKKLPVEKSGADFCIFNVLTDKEVETRNCMKTKQLSRLKFLGPFERYKLVKSFVKAEEEKKATKAASQPNKSIDTSETHSYIPNNSMQKPKEPTVFKSLMEMGGFRKRKREKSEQITSEVPVEHFENNVKVNRLQATTASVSNVNLNQHGKKSKNNKKNKDHNVNNKGPNKSNAKHQNQPKWQSNNQEINTQQSNSSQRHLKQPVKSYDYSSVDYNQFQGGSHTDQGKKHGQYKSQFKERRGKRNFRGKNTNKSSTFHN